MNILYDKIDQWHQNIEQCQNSLQTSNKSSSNWPILWELHLQGQKYRLELTHSLIEGETQTILEEANQLFIQGEILLHHLIYLLPIENRDFDEIQNRISWTRDHLDQLYLDTQIDDRDELIQVMALVHELRFLKRITSSLSDQVDSYQADLINEIFNVGETDWYQDAIKRSQFHSSFNQLYFESLNREVIYLEQEALDIQEVDLIWSLMLWSSEIEMNMIFE